MEYNKNLDLLNQPYEPDSGQKSFEEVEEARLNYERIYYNNNFFHPWNCVSLHLENATVDIALKNKEHCFALLHVLNHLVNKVPEQKSPCSCLKPFNVLNFKMKVAYESWRLRVPLQNLFKYAIQKTLHQMNYMSLYQVKAESKDSNYDLVLRLIEEDPNLSRVKTNYH